MLHSVGSQVTNGWNAFNAAVFGNSVSLSDCDFFSVNVTGTWVGTLKWMGSLDNVNWFDMALQNANGAVTPAVSLTSTGTDKNGNYFASAGSGLLYVRVVTSAWTSGTAYVYTAKHRGTYVSGQDFWDTAMPFTRDAVFAIDASRSSVGETVVVNAGSGGTALNATLGSTGGADSNDPLLLPWTGENYLYLPGVAGNYASAPDSAALDITGDVEMVCRVALDDWSPATAQSFVGKWTTSTNQRSYNLQLSGTSLTILASSDGLNNGASEQCAVTFNTAVDGNTYWIKCTRATGTGLCSFFYAPDQSTEPATWTSIGTNTMTYTGSIFSGSGIIEVGTVGQGASFPLAGRMYRAIVRNGIGGTTVFDANLTTGITSGAQATFTESSSNAATVTINRSTAGRKSVAVTRPVWLLGTDDYMEVADNALLNMDASQSFTVVAVVRQWATPASYGRYVDKKNGGGAGVGWSLSNDTTTFTSASFIGDGTNGVGRTGTALIAGAASTVVGVTDRTAQTQTTYANTTASATTSIAAIGTLTNGLPMRVGCSALSAASYQDFELLAVAVFRRALTATEIATINTYYGTA